VAALAAGAARAADIPRTTAHHGVHHRVHHRHYARVHVHHHRRAHVTTWKVSRTCTVPYADVVHIKYVPRCAIRSAFGPYPYPYPWWR
jgi:hypothetical protein